MENTGFFSPKGLLENIQLKSSELEVISNQSLPLESETTELPKIIYGRMLSGKSVNKGGLKSMFESLWQNKAGVNVEDYADGIVILTFESDAVKNIILMGQPWHIANAMGEFMEFDSMNRRSFMRFRVGLDPSKPLLRGKLLNLDKRKDNIWVSFRYERLAKFCYFCGKIDHIQKDCVALVEEMENGHKPILQYKVSLKTAGLGHVTSNEENLTQMSNKQQILNNVEAARTNSEVPALDPAAKRLRIGNTNDR